MSALSYTNFVCIDGSKSRDGVGFGVVYGADLGNHIFETLPKEATVCTAELHSIKVTLFIMEASNEQK